MPPGPSKELVNFDDGAQVQELLETRLTKDEIATRDGGGAGKVSYIEAWRVIEKAQTIFGFNGWSSRILDIHKEYEDQNAQTQRWNVGYTCIIRVELKDGTFHDDVGFGSVHNERDRGKAIENARKEAVSDGVKRALRYFGAALGNCVYDKVHVKTAQAAPKKPAVPAATAAPLALPPPQAAAGPVPVAAAPGAAAPSGVAPMPMQQQQHPLPQAGLPPQQQQHQQPPPQQLQPPPPQQQHQPPPRCGLRAARRHRSRSRRRSTMGTTARSVAASRRSVV